MGGHPGNHGAVVGGCRGECGAARRAVVANMGPSWSGAILTISQVS